MLLKQQPITPQPTPAGALAPLPPRRLLSNSTSTSTSTNTNISSGARRRNARAPIATCPRRPALPPSNASAKSQQEAAEPSPAPPSPLDPRQQHHPLALKEWAVTIDALLAGEQVVLLRKGGLLDGKFSLEAREFLLFPTTFHVKEPDLLTPEAERKFAAALAMPEPKTLGCVPLKCRVRVEEAWTTADGRVVAALAGHDGGDGARGLHVWGPAFVEARLKWKPGAPMTLALVRASALVVGGGGGRGSGEGGEGAGAGGARSSFDVRQRADYYGCFSWTRVEPWKEEANEFWRPVLSDEEFARRAALVRRRLADAAIDATPLELP